MSQVAIHHADRRYQTRAFESQRGEDGRVRRDVGQDRTIEKQAREELERVDHFRGRTSLVKLESRDGRLVVTGKLPSFYLKQLLQTALMKVEGVRQLHNDVEVINHERLYRD